jgi:hypothetical protein
MEYSIHFVKLRETKRKDRERHYSSVELRNRVKGGGGYKPTRRMQVHR